MKTFKNFLLELTTYNEQLDVKVHSVDQLSKKYKKPVSEIKKLVNTGSKVEAEHTTNKKAAEKIALAHIGEVPDYYDKLKKCVEK